MRLFLNFGILSTIFLSAGYNFLASSTANAVNIIDSTYGVGAGSFELGNFINGGGIPPTAPGYMGLVPGDTTITGWTVGGPGDGVDWLIEPNYNADTGVHSVDLQHLSASSIFTSIPTVVGSVYSLSFATATFQGRNAQGEVSAGSLVNQPFTATFSSSPSSQTFTPFTFQFTATNLTTIVQFTSTGLDRAYGPVIDSVGVELVSEPVPEPLTILGSATALGFGAFFKRKLKPSKPAEKETTKVF